MLYSIADLDDDKLGAVKKLEDEVGSQLIAMSTVKVNAAAMPEEKLSKIRKLEKELGIVLVAVQPN